MQNYKFLFAGVLAAAAVVPSARATTILFTDSYDSGANSNINAGYNSGRQSGLDSPLQYVGQNPGNASINSSNQMVVPVSTHVSPNFDFFTAPTVPTPTTLEVQFDFLASGNYGSFKIGSGTGQFGNAGTDGFGVIFGTTGGQLFYNGTGGSGAGFANFTPATGGALNHFDFTLTNNGNGTDTINFTINSTSYGPYTLGGGHGVAAAQAYITLADDIGGGTQTLFDNLSVTTPIPEPASVGMLAIGGLGLLARRRRCQ